MTDLAEQPQVPLRDRNALLLAAGYARMFGKRSLEGPGVALSSPPEETGQAEAMLQHRFTLATGGDDRA